MGRRNRFTYLLLQEPQQNERFIHILTFTMCFNDVCFIVSLSSCAFFLSLFFFGKRTKYLVNILMALLSTHNDLFLH